MSHTDLNGDSGDVVDTEKYHFPERDEEVKDIIERMPTRFGLRISAIVLSLFILLLIFGWVIRYPDIVKGQVTVNTALSPIKLVAGTSGKLRLNNKTSQSQVSSGDIVAYIESATVYDTLRAIKKILEGYNFSNTGNTSILSKLPFKVALGELTSKYYAFYNSLQQMANFNNDRLYDKQIASLHNLHLHQVSEVANSTERISFSNNALEYARKFLKRDSLLFLGRAAAEAELDRTKMEYLNNLAGVSIARSSLIEAEKESQQTLSMIAELNVQKSEKRKELEIALLSSYSDLVDNIVLWEQRYLFEAPFKGRVQFLRFWTDNQFIQAGEPVFTIVPDVNESYGQVLLPTGGTGKVKIGQEVIVKLDDFPYNEYGSIKGTISSISLTTNTEKTAQGSTESYLVTVRFPEGLITNYGKQIEFRHELKGSAEIVTKDRRLLERLFDNLKYAINK